MPTASKLVAAIILAITGWLCAELIKPLLEENRDLTYFSPICAAMGALVGWRSLGGRIDQGLGGPFANALTATFLQTLSTLFVFAFARMYHESLRKAYDGPFEAIKDIFIIGSTYFNDYFTPEVIATGLVGGAVASGCAYAASRKWG